MTPTDGESIAPGRDATSPRSGAWVTDASLVLMALIWGINFSVVKFATGLMHPLAFNAIRVALAAATLLLLASLGSRAWPSRRVVVTLLALGALGNGLYQVFFVEGISQTRAGDASLVIAATPAFIAILGRFGGVERIRPRGWMGILLSIMGIGLVTFGSAAGAGGEATLIGDALIVCGSLCWAVYTVLLKPYTHDVDGVKLSALTMAGGAVPLFLFAWPNVRDAAWSQVPASAWQAMAFSGLGALVFAYLLWYRGVRMIGPTRTAMYSNLQPIFAVFVAWLVLGEIPTLWQGVGAASVMSGLLLART